jgi:hypothetical protein
MRTARRIFLLLAACFALLACNDRKEGPGDTGPERFSGTIVQKRPLGTKVEFGVRKQSDVGPNCWQLIVENTVNKKEEKVCVSAQTWDLVYVGDPFFRLQKYKPGKK